MRIAVPAEIKNNEYRVAITPAGVKDLVSAGHSVLIQSGAGVGSNITDDEYAKQGAEIEKDAAKVWPPATRSSKSKSRSKANTHTSAKECFSSPIFTSPPKST